MWFDKGHAVINSLKIIWIFHVANSINIDPTGKQHSRHQQFWRFPLSPFEASGRLPRSRDHLFSYSMSKANPTQGPDMWYFTFYENKVPIYQTTISNSLYFKLKSHTSHFCTKLWSKTYGLYVKQQINRQSNASQHSWFCYARQEPWWPEGLSPLSRECVLRIPSVS